MATPLSMEKFGRIEFSQGRWITRVMKTPKSILPYVKVPGELVRIFSVTIVAVGVTFLEVIRICARAHTHADTKKFSFYLYLWQSPPFVITFTKDCHIYNASHGSFIKKVVSWKSRVFRSFLSQVCLGSLFGLCTYRWSWCLVSSLVWSGAFRWSWLWRESRQLQFLPPLDPYCRTSTSGRIFLK